MDVELLVIPDCPHAEDARALLRTALDDIGLSFVRFDVTVVGADDDVPERRFAGSPTYLVDGSDLFPARVAEALACRTFATPSGLRGLPDRRSLRQALKQAADHPAGNR